MEMKIKRSGEEQVGNQSPGYDTNATNATNV